MLKLVRPRGSDYFCHEPRNISVYSCFAFASFSGFGQLTIWISNLNWFGFHELPLTNRIHFWFCLNHIKFIFLKTGQTSPLIPLLTYIIKLVLLQVLCLISNALWHHFWHKSGQLSITAVGMLCVWFQMPCEMKFHQVRVRGNLKLIPKVIRWGRSDQLLLNPIWRNPVWVPGLSSV